MEAGKFYIPPREREAIKTCPVCGKVFYIPQLTIWAYKKNVKRKDTNHNMLYFCRYNCKRKYDEQFSRDEIIARKRETEKAVALRNGRGKKRLGRPPTPEEDYTEKQCAECRYCMQGKYGFMDCTVYSMAINPHRSACKRYRSKDSKEE